MTRHPNMFLVAVIVFTVVGSLAALSAVADRKVTQPIRLL